MISGPTAVLEEEHRHIQKVVAVMAVLLEALEKARDVNVQTLRDILDFMQGFVDRCHHVKEEDYLFPSLEARGVPMQGCPIGALIHEHQKGRTFVAELAEALDAHAKDKALPKDRVAKCLRELTGLYPNHIWKEDYLLFPMTNKILSADDQKDLMQKFEAVEHSIGHDAHYRFEHLVERLAAEAQGPPSGR
jgi:hemerythrin-like domain-containing protein